MAINGKSVLALVPARGGSKGLPGKNMLKALNVPLVGYTLASALRSNYIDEVFLTSDDDATLLYGEKCGVNVVVRPAKFANDEAPATGVVRHFLKGLPDTLTVDDPYIVYLQPTSPLRTEQHIDTAIELMIKANLNKLVSVVKMDKTPFKAFTIGANESLKSLFDEGMTNNRRQDFPQVYLPNGAIYIFALSDFVANDGFPSNGSFPYVMNTEDSLDIDDKKDFDIFKDTVVKNELIRQEGVLST